MKVINKIGFIIHDPTIYDHFKNVLISLGSEWCDVVLANNLKGDSYIEFISILNKNRHSIKYLDDIINIYKYKYLITNHYISGSSEDVESNDQYLPCWSRLLKLVRLKS